MKFFPEAIWYSFNFTHMQTMPPRLRASCQLALSPASFNRRNSCNSRSPRLFSTSSRLQTRQRRMMFNWFRNQGAAFEKQLPGSTNYLAAYTPQGILKRTIIPEKEAPENINRLNQENQSKNSKQSGLGQSGADESIPPESGQDLTPFPLNKFFKSQPVVNEEMREDIWTKVMKDGHSVRKVSAELGVEMSRVGAIVRLKEVEKEWLRKGKRLARPYAKAMMEMLPKTNYPYNPKSSQPQAHEPINDLPVHGATIQQIFLPTSESRVFTRTDAAKVFDEALLPADDRVPHPELAELERDRLAGMSYETRVTKAANREYEAMEKKATSERRHREREASSVKVVSGKRWNFRFKEISVDDIGADGRGHRGTGWRYGIPHMDRKRGEVKITETA